MKLSPLAILFIAIVAEVIGTTALKQSAGFTRPIPLVVTALSYALAFYFLSLTLERIPTGVAYAIWSGVGIVLITALAWLVHGQKLDLPALIGIGLIIAGVAVLNLFSKSGAA
ncbi:SMR family transporter [Novosphingobium sp.]|uniref:SMR family transporter n=1 Tax=Novosphingobium sp. TaxID=1874826 RepID=UPI0038BD38BD